jgi:hypothetical protein
MQVSVAEANEYSIFPKQIELQSLFNHDVLSYKIFIHFITLNYGTNVVAFLLSSTKDEA